MHRRVLAFILVILFAGAVVAHAKSPIYTSFFSDVAIKGYDPVAYHTQGQAIKGSASFTHAWNGATWRFASAHHRDLFAQNPERFAPRYGGYCAWAVSQGTTAGVDPTIFKIVDGRLYLNYSAKIQTKWEADLEGNIAKADRNWPGVLD